MVIALRESVIALRETVIALCETVIALRNDALAQGARETTHWHRGGDAIGAAATGPSYIPLSSRRHRRPARASLRQVRR